MRNALAVVALVLMFNGATSSPAQAKAVVEVSFELAVTRWQGTFGPGRDEVQKKAGEAIATWLGQQVGFVAFESGSLAPYKMLVRLELTPDAGTRQYKETQLRLELGGQVSSAPLVWRFRSEERYGEPTGGVDAFVREIGLRFTDMDKQGLIKQILSRIPITKEAQLWKDPVGWVMPYRKSELCMDFKSMLRIESMMPSGAGPVLKEFLARASGDFSPRDTAPASLLMRGRLFTEPMPLQEGLLDLGNAKPELVTIRAVYVTDYQPLQPCTKPVPPNAVDFRAEAQ